MTQAGAAEPADLYAFLDLLVDESPDACVLVSLDGQIAGASTAFERLSGFSRAELVGQPIEILVPEEMRGTHVAMRHAYASAEAARSSLNSLSTVLRRADGSAVDVQIGLTTLHTDTSAPMTLATVHDASEMVRAIQSRERQEERYRVIFEGNMAPMAVVDLEDRIIEVNDAFCDLIGYSRSELIGRDPTGFTHPEDLSITYESRAQTLGGEDRVRYSKRYIRRNGEVITVEVMRTVARDEDGTPIYHLISERDVSEEVRLTNRLRQQALSDSLTGLPNRVLLEDRFSQARARSRRQGSNDALFFIDVDEFKGVNDSLGHSVGDDFLVAVARRLEVVTRPSDTLCRFGGDEFVYLATDVHSSADALGIAERISRAFDDPFLIGAVTIARSVCVGLAMSIDGEDLTDLLRRADIALYEAKRSGRHQIVTYDASMQDLASTRFTLEQDLRTAIWTDQITMHYQPIVNLRSGEIRGFEALMRWRHPSRGAIAPSVFIPVAEESDLIVDVGKRALTEALHAAEQWRRARPESPPYLAVNASARRFHQPAAIDWVLATTAEADIPTSSLVIEITEQAILGDPEGSHASLQRLLAKNVRVALDDFGTGYSSLSHLLSLRPSIIKVDRAFTSAISESEESAALVSAIAHMGQRLDIELVAEGVESELVREHLVDAGYQWGQGFLWSQAVPADEALELLRDRRAD